MILTDELVDRVHAADMATFREFAQGVRTVVPHAVDAPMGTGYALFAGEGSPLTQVAGFAHRTAGDPDAVEAFYAGLASNWEVSVTPFTDQGTVRALLDRGYRPQGFESQLAMVVEEQSLEAGFEIVEVGPGEKEAWTEASDRAWTEDEGPDWTPGDLIRAIAPVPARNYVAYVDGIPAAAASMSETDGAVLLRGGATRVPFRGRGLQSALLRRRLRDAARGSLALIGAEPGSSSYRNAQRAGFSLLYNTLTLMRRLDSKEEHVAS